jgi:hypothetical protein
LYDNKCIDNYCDIKDIYKGLYIAQRSVLSKGCDRIYSTFVFSSKFSFRLQLTVRSAENKYVCEKKITHDSKYYNKYYHGKDPGGVSVEIAKKLIDYFEKHLDLRVEYVEVQ